MIKMKSFLSNEQKDDWGDAGDWDDGGDGGDAWGDGGGQDFWGGGNDAVGWDQDELDKAMASTNTVMKRTSSYLEAETDGPF